jgi:acetyl esterase/lipase
MADDKRQLPALRQLPLLLPRGRALLRVPMAGLRFDMDLWENVSYGDAPEQALDVWELNDMAPRDGWPAVLLLHGGGWVSGARNSFPIHAPLLARQGLLVASASYRLGRAGRWPAQLEDVLAAVETLCSLQVDPTRVALWGASAGGHLALLAAQHLGPERIRAVVTVGAPTDLTRLDPDQWPELAEVFEDLAEASPALRMQALPPTLALHGALDDKVPVDQARRLAAAHAEVEARVVPGGDHMLRLPPGWWATRAARRWVSARLTDKERGSKWRRRRRP